MNAVINDNLKIEYIIEDDQPMTVKHWTDISGGVRLTYKNIILTKMVDYPDEGYIGDWIFHNIEVWMRAIKRLVNEGKSNLDFADGPYYFRFRLSNNLVYFLVDLGNDSQNKLYPGKGKGCPIPAKLFLKESVDMGRRFIDDIISRYKDMDVKEINIFKEDLSEAECCVDNYLRSH